MKEQRRRTSLPAGISYHDRSSLGLLASFLRNPLTSVPPASFSSRMVLTQNFGQTNAYISDPHLLQEALVTKADHFAKSFEMKQVLSRAVGNSILTADGPKWRWQRYALAPAFRQDRLSGFAPTMIKVAETTRDAVLRAAGTVVDFQPMMMSATFDVLLETMLSGRSGIDRAAIERSVSDFLAATSWMFGLASVRLPLWIPFPGSSQATRATRFMRRTIVERVAGRRSSTQIDDLIGMLLSAADPETRRTLTDHEITDNILAFVMAGYETTAVALGWTFALLVRHPAHLERMLDEIELVTRGDAIAPHHLPQLVYVRQVVSEGMRLYPPVPMLARSVIKDVDIGGFELPRGVVAVVPIHAIHRHRDLWTDPDAFNPDRFAMEAIRERHRYAYMPFGLGARVCIGSSFAMMEAVAMLAVLVRAVRLETVEPVLPEPVMKLTLRPKRPILMKVLGPRTRS